MHEKNSIIKSGPIFCPHSECPSQEKKEYHVIKSGTYFTANGDKRQEYKCKVCGRKFSETSFSGLYGKQGSEKEYVQTAKLLSYGLNTEQIADVLERDIRTIHSWMLAIGQKAEKFHIFACLMSCLTFTYLQMDELWSYLMNKRKQLWVFIGFEAKTKFWINFELGSRTNNIAQKLVVGIKRLGNCKGVIVTTDKLAAYKNALEKVLKKSYSYLQIVKQRIGRRLRCVKQELIRGKWKDFPDGTRNTSYIERLNLTLRQNISYLTRKTIGYCKNKTSYKLIMWINLFNYNYIKFHKSLREEINKEAKFFTRRYNHRTPAMAIGITDEQFDWKSLFLYPVPT